MIIINAKIITMENDNFENGYIKISDGIIEAVGDMKELTDFDNEVIDVNGKMILPGFIDCHCHIGMWEDGLGFEGDDGNEETDPITPHLRAIDAINPFDDCFSEATQAGVTTVLTGPGSANPIAGQWCAMKTNGNRIDDMIINPNVGMKFALGENPKSTYNSKNQTPVTRMATVALIREQLEKSKRYMQDIERANEDDEIDPPEFDAKCEAMIAVLQRKTKAFFHAHRTDDIFTAIRISKEYDLDYVIVHGTEGYKIAKQLNQEGAKVISGPIICDRSKPELKGLTPKNTAALSRCGVECAICTDHPVIPIQYLSLSAAVACREGLDYNEALKNITINAAKICGVSDRVGSIKKGKDADLVVFDSDPLNVMAKPESVYISGEKVF